MKSKLQQNNKNVQKGKIVKIFSDFASEFYQVQTHHISRALKP